MYVCSFKKKKKKPEEIATFLLKTSQALTGERKEERRKERKRVSSRARVKPRPEDEMDDPSSNEALPRK